MSHQRNILAMLTAGALALGAAGASFAHTGGAQSGATTLSPQDRAFVATATSASAEEVAAGKIAEHDSENRDVQRFAHRMVQDHTRASDELKRIAQSDGFALPHGMDATARHEVGALRKTKSHDARFGFDARYMAHQASDHHHVIDAFRKEADQGRNADLRRFATDTLPTLREHLQLAEQTQRDLPGTKPVTLREENGLQAAKAATGASSVAAEKNEHMPVPKTGM